LDFFARESTSSPDQHFKRGFGPMDLGQIAVGGDFPLAEVQANISYFQMRFHRFLSRFFD
jgi:hypothetical protein